MRSVPQSNTHCPVLSFSKEVLLGKHSESWIRFVFVVRGVVGLGRRAAQLTDGTTRDPIRPYELRGPLAAQLTHYNFGKAPRHSLKLLRSNSYHLRGCRVRSRLKSPPQIACKCARANNSSANLADIRRT